MANSKATKQTQTRRCKTFKCCKMMLEDAGEETRPRGTMYPTPPSMLAKILTEMTMHAYSSFVKSRMLRPLKTHFLLFQQIFFILVCIHPGTPRVPPLVLASEPKPCGGNKSICVSKREFWYKIIFNLNLRIEKSRLSYFESYFKTKFPLTSDLWI